LVNRGGKIHLVLTTADEGMSAEFRAACPNAGNLFIAETTLNAIPAEDVIRL
jgi:hypothetical protein